MPTPLRRRLRHARRLVGYGSLVVLVLVALLVGVANQLLPLAERNPDRIAAWLSERAGRPVHGDWSWLNGSVGWAALHAVHHRYYDTAVPNPNIWPTERVYDPSGVVKTTLRERHDTAHAQED